MFYVSMPGASLQWHVTGSSSHSEARISDPKFPAIRVATEHHAGLERERMTSADAVMSSNLLDTTVSIYQYEVRHRNASATSRANRQPPRAQHDTGFPTSAQAKIRNDLQDRR